MGREPIRFDEVINERSMPTFSVKLRDSAKQPIPGSELVSLTLTYCDVETGEIINGRDEQNVLNQNNVTISEAGVLAWLLQPADTAIVNPAHNKLEEHLATFLVVYNDPPVQFTEDVLLTIRNLAQVS